nr:acyltransferase family protein [uncultured Cohaesibacter sp.]
MKDPVKSAGYRPDIDGVRAFAVLSVFLFHLNFAFIPGGFVGVDVFYVISGYVILRSMLPDIIDGKFSLAGFYDRRIRRIYPALILVVALALAVGFIINTPKEFVSLAESSVAALFSGSNIYFNDRLDYFAAAARTIPLLHTWSLGVEFQFYLLIPLLLLFSARFATNRSKAILMTLLALLAISFISNVLAVYLLFDSNFAFYMPITRFWEIGVGGLIAYWDGRFKPGKALSAVLTYAAIIGLVASVTLIDENTTFPGLVALLPVLATAALVQIVPRNGSFYKRVVTSPPALFFGQISYSLYLFHWPIIVFPALYLGRDLVFAEKCGLFLLATGLSFLSWKFIETPLRRAREGRRHRLAFGGMGATLAALCLIAGIVINLQGVPQRLNPPAQEIYYQVENGGAPVPPCDPIEGLHGMRKAAISSCQTDGASDNDLFVLWGDSHAGMLWHELKPDLGKLGMSGILAVMPACPALLDVHTSKLKNREECAQLGLYLQQVVKAKKAPLVVLSTRWGNYASDMVSPGDGGLPTPLFDDKNNGQKITFSDALSRTVQYFTELGAHVVIVGPVPEIDYNVPEMLIRSSNLKFPLPISKREAFDKRQANTLYALKRLEKIDDITVTYPHEQLCSNKACTVVKGQRPLYTDDDHLSNLGVDLILPDIIAAMRSSLAAKK